MQLPPITVYFTNSSVKARGIILRALREHPKELSLPQFAKEVGLPGSTVQRIISSLEQEEFVIAASSHNGLEKKLPLLKSMHTWGLAHSQHLDELYEKKQEEQGK
jgi:DNA-binding IclR family transcriptional regulator